MRPHRTQFWLATFVRIIANILWSLGPLLIAKTVQVVQAGQTEQAYYCLAAIVIAHTLASIIGLTRAKIEGPFMDRVKREMTLYAMNHMLQIGLGWHEGQGTGNKMQRIFTARNAMQDLLFMWYVRVLPLIGLFIGVIITLTTLHEPFFILLFTLYVLGYIFLGLHMARGMIKLNEEIEEYFERIIGKIYEFSSNTLTVKVMGLLKYVRQRAWRAESVQMKKLLRLYKLIWVRWGTLVAVSSWVVYGGIAAYGLWLVTVGQLSVVSFITILWLGERVWTNLESIAGMQEDYFQKRIGFMRICQTLNQPIAQLDIQPLQKLTPNWQEIMIDNLSYTYDHRPVLSNISLRIPRGQKVALIGPSGAGKSTFVKLLLKQLLPASGSIYFDNLDTRHIPLNQLTEHVAVVLQDTELFDISIKENVLIKSKHPRKFKQYLKMAHATEFVNELPKKEMTLIGERGVKLSGGQKQRIGIARALAQEAEIIIFDEATSALDTESERAIQAAMKEMFVGRTAFIIAHRLSTIRHVDRILVFEDGRIIEDGSFDQLAKKRGGHFARLWKLQKLD